MILNRRALIHAKRPQNYTRAVRELCWVCHGLAFVNVPDHRAELGVVQERCINCAGTGQVTTERR